MSRCISCLGVLLFASVALAQSGEPDEIVDAIGVRAVVPGPLGGPVAVQPVGFQPVNPPPPLSSDNGTFQGRILRLAPIRPPAPSPAGPPLNDHLGDAMPAGAIARYGTTRLRHGSEPLALAFSADGKKLASLSASEAGVRIWDVDTGKELARHDGRVDTVALAPDGQLVLVNGDKCQVWSPALGTIRSLPEGSIPEGTTTLAVAADSRSFAAGSPEKIALIDIQSGKTLRTLKLPRDQPPLRLVYSLDGRWLAGCGQNKSGVWLWELKSGKRVRTYPTEADFTDFAFSVDGNQIAIGGSTLSVHTTDSEELPEGFHIPEEGQFFGVRFGPDGKHVFALQQDGTVMKVDAATGEIRDSWPPPEMNFRNPLTLAPGVDRVAAVDMTGGIRIWEPKTGKTPEAKRHSWLAYPGFSADGKLASVLDQESRIHTFDPATGKPVSIIELPVEPFMPSSLDARTGRAIAIIGGESFEVQVLDVATLKVLATFETTSNAYPSAVFSPSDKDKIAVFAPGTVSINSLSTGRAVRTLNVGHADDLNPRGNFSPDGRLLAITTQPLSVWEVATGKKRFECEGMPFPMEAHFSPNGRWLAVQGADDMVALYDVRTGATLRRFTVPSADGSVSIVAFTPDSKRLVTGNHDGLITLWDIASGEPVLNLDRHDGSILGLAFSKDGKRLLSSASDGTVLVWDLNAKLGSKEARIVAGQAEAFELLGSTDASQAHRGQDYLYRQPADSVTMLAEKLAVPKPVPAATIAKWITDLGSDDYQTRRAAVKGLLGIGGEALPALREVLASSPNAEVRKLAEEAVLRLEAIPTKPDELRVIRAVEVLENLAQDEGVPKAVREQTRELVKQWAAGPRGHRQTEEARMADRRLDTDQP